MPPPDENEAPATVKEKSVKKKKKKMKEGDAKEEEGGEKKNKKSKKNKSTKKEKAQTVRLSSSSFEVGGLTASPEAPKTIGPKKTQHSWVGFAKYHASSNCSRIQRLLNRRARCQPAFS
jgi:serine/arginine repetitive matrix protein 2